RLVVEGASSTTLWTIALSAVAIFIWQLVRNQVSAAWAKLPGLPTPSAGFSARLAAPSTQRWIIAVLVVIGFVWPFFSSRGAVDIATLALIYVLLGLGLNIVVGLAGLLDLGYVGFYA